MKKVLRVGIIIAAFSIQLLITSSCVSLLFNDNSILYNTEWSVANESEGLKFYNDNSVLYFATGVRGTGRYNYSSSDNIITFENLSANFPYFTAEFQYAELIDSNTMKLWWHQLGSSENYYELLYKRR